VSDKQVTILRPGVIGPDELQDVLQSNEIDVPVRYGTTEQTTPGTKYKHYAPKTKIREITSPDQFSSDKRVVFISTDEYTSRIQNVHTLSLGSLQYPRQIASALYQTMFKLDQLHAAEALIFLPEINHPESHNKINFRIMKNILLLLSVLFMINSSCNTQHQHAQDDMNTTFESLTVQLVHDFMTLNPTWALSIGLHTNDSTLEVLTPDLRKDKLNRYSTWADSLQSFPDDKLSMRNRMDKSMLLNYFNYFKWQSEIFKSHTWNPAEYNIGEGFDLVINNPDATLNQKLDYALARLYRKSNTRTYPAGYYAERGK
jgi:hypothetical protein